jgi:glycosyltransferase involved in cell wall biosynthesis
MTRLQAPGPPGAPAVVLSANNFWNIAHFRKPMLSGLAKAGYRLVALAAPDGHMDELRGAGIDVRPLPISRSGTNPAADLWMVLQYARALRAIRPAAYCSFTIKPNIYGGIAARLAGVPVIANVTGLGTSFIGKGATWALVRRLYQLAFRAAHTVFFHNAADREFMIEQDLVSSGQAKVIPGSGVDLEWFKPAAAGTSGRSELKFLFIGRLLVHKGIGEFVEAARLLRQRLPDARFQLLGTIDPGNPSSLGEPELQSLVDEGLVEHLGEHHDVRPAIAAATAVVLPSYREGLSRALLEGAAMGKPLVGADVPGIRELVEEGVTGALCKDRDAGSLAEAMERIALASPEAIERMGRNARTMVERNYSEQVVVDAYLDVLARIRAQAPR